MTTNAITTAYLAEISRQGMRANELLDAAKRSFDVSATSYFGRFMTRPVFLDHAEFAGLRHDISFLHSALTDLPRRLFGGDIAAFGRAVGLTEAQVAAVARSRDDAPTHVGRADFYRDETGFRVLEVNMGSTTGGMDNAHFNRAVLTHPLVAEFATAHKLSFIDSMAVLADTMRAECQIPAGSRPLVAAADWPESFPSIESLLTYSATYLSSFGMDVIACHLGQLSFRDGRVWLDGRPVDIVYRVFMIEDLLHPDGPGLINPVLDAVERGEVKIFTPMDADLYGSKGALALLSDEANRHRYDAGELAHLDRILPWTRMVRPGHVTVDDERVDLGEYAFARREELILKPTAMHGGIGVVPGWLTEPDDWNRQLTAAMGGPFVLQRRIRPSDELFPTDGEPEPWVVTWGVFMAMDGYNGLLARGSTDPGGGVINMATGASATCCFHQAEQE